ncbi:MAG: AAA family ATPase, partial [Actinomycetota bacterium]|nr:AAA family ATPase [Actinomycetota bacterium]
MRLALAGKGGSGKTTLSATLARLQARAGLAVVVIDADSNPNVSVAMGLEAVVGPMSLPYELVSRRPTGPRLTVPVDEVLSRHGATGPDGIRLAVMGAPDHADAGCLCSAHAAVSALLADLGERPDVLTVVDLEGSPEHLSRGTARHADLLLLVAEPYFRSLETVRRLSALARQLPIPQVAVVANKVRSTTDAAAIRDFARGEGLEVLGEIPWSTDVLDADAARTPLLDAVPDSGVVQAIRALALALDRVGEP